LRAGILGRNGGIAHLRRRPRGREGSDDCLSKCRAGQDARLPAPGDRDLPAGRRERNLETMIAPLLLTLMQAQWPPNSLERPKPPVVTPAPEQPPVPPPADAIVL